MSAPSEFETTTVRLVDQHDVLLLDLDGVVYRSDVAVEHAVEVLRQVPARCAYVTNNASRPPEHVAEHLRALGLVVDVSDVVTSAQAGASVLAASLAVGSRVLAVGGIGVAEALRHRGFDVCRAGDDHELDGEFDAVMMGYGPDVSWRDLAAVSYAVVRGLPFVATNTDASIPTSRGVAPGNGTLVAAVVTATGRTPVVAGKPYAPLMQESVERTRARHALVIGDRLDTDIAGAAGLMLPSLFVLTGVHTLEDLADAPVHQRPTYVSDDLRGLLSDPRALTVPAWIRSVWASRDAPPDVDGAEG